MLRAGSHSSTCVFTTMWGATWPRLPEHPVPSPSFWSLRVQCRRLLPSTGQPSWSQSGQEANGPLHSTASRHWLQGAGLGCPGHRSVFLITEGPGLA